MAKKTETITIRLDADLLNNLKSTAKKEGISANAKIAGLLKYVVENNTITVPEYLIGQLEDVAAREYRSLPNMIEFILVTYIKNLKQ